MCSHVQQSREGGPGPRLFWAVLQGRCLPSSYSCGQFPGVGRGVRLPLSAPRPAVFPTGSDSEAHSRPLCMLDLCGDLLEGQSAGGQGKVSWGWFLEVQS